MVSSRNDLKPHLHIEQVSHFERNDHLDAIDAVAHVHHAIHYSKDFSPIVDVLDVGQIGRVQAYDDAVRAGNIESSPWAISTEFFASNNFHRMVIRD